MNHLELEAQLWLHLRVLLETHRTPPCGPGMGRVAPSGHRARADAPRAPIRPRVGHAAEAVVRSAIVVQREPGLHPGLYSHLGVSSHAAVCVARQGEVMTARTARVSVDFHPPLVVVPRGVNKRVHTSPTRPCAWVLPARVYGLCKCPSHLWRLCRLQGRRSDLAGPMSKNSPTAKCDTDLSAAVHRQLFQLETFL